jgi:hypothetical protein
VIVAFSHTVLAPLMEEGVGLTVNEAVAAQVEGKE